MKTVLAAGVFDFLHPGHRFFLQSARSLGDRLVVVVARDANVKRIKGFFPTHQEDERVKMVSNLGIAERVMLGKPGGNFLAIIEELQPDIIAVGYDQQIPQTLTSEFPHIEVIRLQSKNPELWKSSNYRNQGISGK